MSPEHQRKIAHLFLELRDVELEALAHRLDEVCRGDNDLRREVEALLALDRRGDSLFPFARRPSPSTEHPPPASVGPYRILFKIGEGGMGVVYLAEQQHPRRWVAVKTLRPALIGTHLVDRFHDEISALGRLRHPAIAQILDAGVAETTRGALPYFSLEFIDGLPLDCYLEEHPMALRDRVALLATLCEGVHYAHQHGIVHRDIKPSNILIDCDGCPKIIDFGVAKILERARTAEVRTRTVAGERWGTIAYMSPEQAAGDPSVDTLTDVYSLGTVAYEMLSGVPAHGIDYLEGKSPPETLKAGQQGKPRPLGELDRNLRGDLELIVAKAMETIREDRYPSASEMAADFRRHLRFEPILAGRRVSLRASLGRLRRRNRAAFSLGIGLTLAIVIGLLISVLGWMRTRTAEATSRNLNELFAELLRSPSPYSGGPNVTVAEVLGVAAARLDSDESIDKTVAASLRHTLGASYSSLSRFDEAILQLRRAHEGLVATRGQLAPETLDCLGELGIALRESGQLTEGRQVLQDSLALHRQAFGSRHQTTLRAMGNLSRCLEDQGHLEEAETLLRETLALQKELLGPAHGDTLAAQGSLASILYFQGRLKEAEALAREAHETTLTSTAVVQTDSLVAANNLLAILEAGGKLDEAHELSEGLLERARSEFGPEHIETLKIETNCGVLLVKLSRREEGKDLLRHNVNGATRSLGATHPVTATAMARLAECLCAGAAWQEAEAFAAKALSALESTYGEDHPNTLDARFPLAVSLWEGMRRDAGLAEMRRALAILRKAYGPDDTATRSTEAIVAGWERQVRRQSPTPK